MSLPQMRVDIRPAGAPVPAIEILRVPCPYCAEGGALLPVEKTSIDDQIRQTREPRRCDHCGKFFRLAVKIAVLGVKIEP